MNVISIENVALSTFHLDDEKRTLIIQLFLSNQDVKESSRHVYKRTLSLFFD